MHRSNDQTLYLLSFDVDGTLTGPNYSIYGIHGKYEMLLRELQQMPGVEVVLNSGKSFQLLESNAIRFGGNYVIACNGAGYKRVDDEPIIFGAGCEHLIILRRHLGLAPRDEGVQRIKMTRMSYEVAIEEDKHDMVLTIFTEPEWVTHRWKFSGGIDRSAMYDHLCSLIDLHTLDLSVLHPHGDGAVDIVRIHKGNPIDKSTLPLMARQIWPTVPSMKIAMFGDGSNDVPAMTAPGVVGITFPESHPEKVHKPVQESGGIITTLPAWIQHEAGGYQTGGGVIEGVKLLAEREFFDDLSSDIKSLCMKYI